MEAVRFPGSVEAEMGVEGGRGGGLGGVIRCGRAFVMSIPRPSIDERLKRPARRQRL